MIRVIKMRLLITQLQTLNSLIGDSVSHEFINSENLKIIVHCNFTTCKVE